MSNSKGKDTLPQGHNNIRQWLEPQLDKNEWSVESFARKCGITRAAIYLFLSGQNTPSEQTMAKMCKALGRPLQEGLSQYTPKPKGRPKGSGTGVRELSRRNG
jgi:transcriptional regulator with XRE-family HTH domain